MAISNLLVENEYNLYCNSINQSTGGGVVTLNGVQTLTNKTITGGNLIGCDIRTSSGSFAATLNTTSLTANRIFLFPGTANNNAFFVMSAGSGQTLSQAFTFSAQAAFNATNSILLSNATPAIVFQPNASGNAYTISVAANPGGNRTLSLYDPGANCNCLLGYNNIIPITVSAVLSAANSGSQVNINSAAAAVAITLPAVANGLHFTFIVCSATLANAVTIGAGSAIILGSLLSSDGTAVTGGAVTTAKSNLIIGTTAAFGDKYELISDGVKWYVTGVTAVHGSITTS